MAAAAFHTLTVADVEELTDDAVAVTFEVPDDLADEFAFVPGQSLTLRRTVDGPDGPGRSGGSTRSASPPGRVRASASGRSRTGCSRGGWCATSGPGDTVEVQTPGGRFCPTRRCSRAAGTSASRPAPASRRCSRWRARCWATAAT